MEDKQAQEVTIAGAPESNPARVCLNKGHHFLMFKQDKYLCVHTQMQLKLFDIARSEEM